MFENLNFETVIAMVITFLSSTAGTTIISLAVNWLKTRKISPAAIAEKVIEDIEDATIKVAVKESVINVLTPILAEQEALAKELEKLQSLLKDNATINALVADTFSRNIKLSDSTRKAFLEAKIRATGEDKPVVEQTPTDTAQVKISTKKASKETAANTVTKDVIL